MKLSDYVRQIMRDKGLGGTAIQRNSHGRITQGYVNDIISEKATNPSVEKLKALALGLGVSEEEVFRVARGLPIDDNYRAEGDKILAIFSDLPPPERAFLVDFGMMLLNRHRTIEAAKAAGKPVPDIYPPPEMIAALDAIATKPGDEDDLPSDAIEIDETELQEVLEKRKRKPKASEAIVLTQEELDEIMKKRAQAKRKSRKAK